MHSIHNALLGSISKGTTQPIGSETTVIDQQRIGESIARGELEELRGAAFHNRTWVATSIRYGTYTINSLGTPHIDKPDHDGLVLDILRIQGLGPLTRPAPWLPGIDIARTVDGTLWNDLPFLVPDMTKYWLESSGAMSSAQRLNFSTFLAKLTATRVCKDRVCQIALHLFCYTFEKAREIRDTEKLEDENTRRRLHDLDYANLLPSACAWIKIAGPNLILLSDAHWSDCPSEIGQGGTLFVESEFGNRCPKGFTPWRWMFWLKRLHEIRDLAKEAEDKEVETLATDAIDKMINGVRERNSNILRVYKNGGAALHKDKHLWSLGKEATSWEDVSFIQM